MTTLHQAKHGARTSHDVPRDGAPARHHVPLDGAPARHDVPFDGAPARHNAPLHGAPARRKVPSATPEAAPMCENAAKNPGRGHDHANRQNEPTGAPARRLQWPAELSLRQRAAARLLARGYSSVEIAGHLEADRHTIARWKRLPLFIAEVERLRRELSAPARMPIAPAPARAPLRPRSKRNPLVSLGSLDTLDDLDDLDPLDEDDAPMSDAEAAATEAWIEQILRAKSTGGKIPPPPPS